MNHERGIGQSLAGTRSAPEPKKGTYFVWVLYKNIFAFRHLQAHVNDSANNPPTVGQGNVELSGKIKRPHRSGAQDDMSRNNWVIVLYTVSVEQVKCYLGSFAPGCTEIDSKKT
jgi:hypothetical protein